VRRLSPRLFPLGPSRLLGELAIGTVEHRHAFPRELRARGRRAARARTRLLQFEAQALRSIEGFQPLSLLQMQRIHLLPQLHVARAQLLELRCLLLLPEAQRELGRLLIAFHRPAREPKRLGRRRRGRYEQRGKQK